MLWGNCIVCTVVLASARDFFSALWLRCCLLVRPWFVFLFLRLAPVSVLFFFSSLLLVMFLSFPTDAIRLSFASCLLSVSFFGCPFV